MDLSPLILIFAVVFVPLGYYLDYKIIGRKRPKKHKVWVWDEIAKAKQPLQLELMPLVVWQDIEDVAKSTPEYKEWKKKHDAKRNARVSERNKWSMDFTALRKELEQKHCKHEYNYESDWLWNVCKECGYEKKWYYSHACTCAYELYISYGSDKYRLTRRNPLCSEHGRDIQKYQEQRYEFHKQELFAKGGIIKKES